jgi:FtsZ-binding cell division protein ZapB
MDKYTIKITTKDIDDVLDRTRKISNIPMQLQYDILHTIEFLTAELDSLRKAYAVTNESWKKLAGENEQLRQEQAGYRDTLEYAKDAIFQDDCSCHGFKKCLRCEALELVDKALGVGE